MAIHEDRIVVGATNDDDLGEFSGAAYLFALNGAEWVQTQKLRPGIDSASSSFGTAAAWLEETLLIGASSVDVPFSSSGAVYFFDDLDCNLNQEVDVCEIGTGDSSDTDGNSIPDECESVIPCDGDANRDGTVDPLDIGFLQSRFGCAVGAGDADCDSADQNDDGSVDPLDSGYVLSRFGDCP